MKRLAVLVALIALPATASAGRPLVEHFQDSSSSFAPAGTVCDFDYREDLFVTGVQQVFFQGGAPVLVRVHFIDLTVIHTNLSDGTVIEETVHVNYAIDLEAETVTISGLWWALPEVTHAGRFIDTPAGPIWATPNVGADFAGVICPAMGGNPA